MAGPQWNGLEIAVPSNGASGHRARPGAIAVSAAGGGSSHRAPTCCADEPSTSFIPGSVISEGAIVSPKAESITPRLFASGSTLSSLRDGRAARSLEQNAIARTLYRFKAHHARTLPSGEVSTTSRGQATGITRHRAPVGGGVPPSGLEGPPHGRAARSERRSLVAR